MSYHTDIVQATLRNTYFRRELFTTERTQVVVMSVEPGDDIGLETHHLDQVLVFVAGEGESFLNGHRGTIGPGSLVVVPAGTEHNFINTGSEPLKLYTVYAPPEHEPGTIHKDKAEAEIAEALEHGHAPKAAATPMRKAGLTVGSLIGVPQ